MSTLSERESADDEFPQSPASHMGPRQGTGRTARRLLMVLYFFPPLGGVSMARNVRHAQYLPRYGWTPVVLTPESGGFELKDPEALGLVPHDLTVLRTRSWEAGHVRPVVDALRAALDDLRPRRGRTSGSLRHRSSRTGAGRPTSLASEAPAVSRLGRLGHLLFFPDEQVGWLPFALSAALRSNRSAKFDVVQSTSSPITSHLVAGLFARLTGTPWVAEFRDPWRGNALAAPLPWFHRRLQAKVERWIFRSADRIVCVTPSLTRLYQKRYPTASIVTITNGYDRAELPVGRTARAKHQRFRIVYTGTLYRPSELETFLEGVALLIRRRPDVADRLEIAFYGQVDNECQSVADRMTRDARLGNVVQFLGFVPRQVALRSLAEADAALVLLGGGPGMGLFIGGKVYDYLGQSKQILAMIPPGDARDVLEGLSWGVIADPDPEDVGRAIERLLTARAPDGPADPLGRYDREALAGRLAQTLAEAVEARTPHPIRRPRDDLVPSGD